MLLQSTRYAGPVWSWFGTCARPARLAVEVRARGRLVRRAVVPLCRVRRADIAQRQYAAQLHFLLRAPALRAAYGAPRGGPVRGDVWQAGADPDAVVLGVSLMTGRRVVLNTVHLLVPGASCGMALDRILRVRSYPVPARPPGAAPPAAAARAQAACGSPGS